MDEDILREAFDAGVEYCENLEFGQYAEYFDKWIERKGLVKYNIVLAPVVESTDDDETFDCRECDNELSKVEISSNVCLSCGCSPAVFFV